MKLLSFGSVSPISVAKNVFIGTAAIAVSLAIWISLPPTPSPLNDDFAYFRSIAATSHYGWPVTDEWLSPWSASLSLISSALFWLTGSFHVATYGLTAALIGLAIFFGVKVLCAREVPVPLAILWVLVALSFPTLLWKIADFGSIPLYLTCLLAAIWFSERNHWVLFGVCWLVALSSRQTALIWLVIPVVAMFERVPAKASAWMIRSACVLSIALVGAGIYLGLSRSMNLTYGRIMDTIAIQRHFAHGFGPPLQQVIVAVIVFVAGAGLGAFVSVSASGARSATRFAAGMSICASLILILSMFMTSDSQDYVLFEQALFSTRAGLMFVGLMNAISIAGWLWGMPTIRLRYLACGAASAAVAGVVPKLWDYYLMDVAVFGIVSAAVPTVASETKPVRFARTIGFAAAAGLLSIQSNFIVTIKKLIDINYAAVALHERALRAGVLSPTDVPDAPFGYQAWHLYPTTFIAENSRGDIRKFIRPQSSLIRWDDADIPPPSEENGRLQPGQTVIASDFFPFRWTQSQRFSLVLNPTPKDAAVSIDKSKYTFDPYPLSNAEWRQYVKNFKPLEIDHERLRIEATPLPGQW